MLAVNVQPGLGLPLHEQIAASIRRQAALGLVAVGATLPAAADLAESLGVNRNTVLRAYRQLAGEHVVDLRRSRGAVVLATPGLDEVYRHMDALLDAAADAGLTVGALLSLVAERAAAGEE